MCLRPPVVQLLLTKRVVDIRDVPCEEHDDPQSNKHWAVFLKNKKGK